MKNYKDEILLNLRYGSTGLLNGLFSVSTILVLTHYSVAPLLVNIIGFFVGIMVSFIVSRLFVFRSNDRLNAQLIRYLLAFIVSFVANVFTLHFCLYQLLLPPLFAQGFAILAYNILMYLASRFFIFRQG